MAVAGPAVVVPGPGELAPFLPPALAHACLLMPAEEWATVEELRLRVHRPVEVVKAQGQHYLSAGGGRAAGPAEALAFGPADARLLFERATQNSAYAWQLQIASGFLTLPGGHRLGLAGRTVIESGSIAGIRQIGSFCLRLAREVRGAADEVLRRMVEPATGRVQSTLIASPPRCGKTTVLRDAIRQLSSGYSGAGTGPLQVSLVDERSEVAGCWQGIPSRDVGPRTDVMDGCPKASGMLTMLRSMSPDLLATDEIGRAEDLPALEEAARAGVTLLATAHAWDLEDLLGRPATRALLRGGHFGRVAILSRQPTPGTLSRMLAPRELGLGD